MRRGRSELEWIVEKRKSCDGMGCVWREAGLTTNEAVVTVIL